MTAATFSLEVFPGQVGATSRNESQYVSRKIWTSIPQNTPRNKRSGMSRMASILAFGGCPRRRWKCSCGIAAVAFFARWERKDLVTFGKYVAFRSDIFSLVWENDNHSDDSVRAKSKVHWGRLSRRLALQRSATFPHKTLVDNTYLLSCLECFWYNTQSPFLLQRAHACNPTQQNVPNTKTCGDKHNILSRSGLSDAISDTQSTFTVCCNGSGWVTQHTGTKANKIRRPQEPRWCVRGTGKNAPALGKWLRNEIGNSWTIEDRPFHG